MHGLSLRGLVSWKTQILESSAGLHGVARVTRRVGLFEIGVVLVREGLQEVLQDPDGVEAKRLSFEILGVPCNSCTTGSRGQLPGAPC